VEQVAQPERPSEAALFAKPKGGFGKNRGNNSQGGNGYNKQPYTDTRKCFYCGKPGHFEKQCRKKKSDEAGSASNGGQHKQFGATALTANTMACNSDGQAMRWVLDTGASRHMTSNKHALFNVRPLEESITITFGQRWHWQGHCRGGAAAAHP
jgi:hypothetical protein